MRYFCTYFDQNYLVRGLALYRSLKHQCNAFTLYILCLDRASHDILCKLHWPGIEPIALDDFERADELLSEAKTNRSPVEYYFTCTPSLPLYVFKNFPDVDVLTYLDADLFFFSDPEPLFEDIRRHSITIVEHRFPPHLKYLERHGIYNVGWLTFVHDENAFACLNWWRESCLAWCYDRCEQGRFADQKYLDQWPKKFSGVAVIKHKGANVGPWNVTNHALSVEGGRVCVGNEPLIFYHFHLLKQVGRWLYDPNLVRYKTKPSPILRRYIYGPYIRALRQMEMELGPLSQVCLEDGSIRRLKRGLSGKHWRSRLGKVWQNAKGLLRGRLIVAPNGKVI